MSEERLHYIWVSLVYESSPWPGLWAPNFSSFHSPVFPQPGSLTSDSALSPLLSHCLGGDLNFLANSWVFSITSPFPLSAPSALMLAPDLLFGKLSSSLLAPWLWLFASSFPSYNHGHEPPLGSFQPILSVTFFHVSHLSALSCESVSPALNFHTELASSWGALPSHLDFSLPITCLDGEPRLLAPCPDPTWRISAHSS